MINKFKLITDEMISEYKALNDEVDYLSILKTNVLHFCACGSDDVMYFLRDLLTEINNYWEHLRAITRYDEKARTIHDAKMLAFFGGNKGALDFMYYTLDELGIMEHGCSIPGWLDTRGEYLLHDLNLAIKEAENAG